VNSKKHQEQHRQNAAKKATTIFKKNKEKMAFAQDQSFILKSSNLIVLVGYEHRSPPRILPVSPI
jgi:hypothetical protein